MDIHPVERTKGLTNKTRIYHGYWETKEAILTEIEHIIVVIIWMRDNNMIMTYMEQCALNFIIERDCCLSKYFINIFNCRIIKNSQNIDEIISMQKIL